MGNKGLEQQMLDHLADPKPIRDSRKRRKWTRQAIQQLVARLKKYRRKMALLHAENAVFKHLEAACLRAAGSTEVEQVLAMLVAFRAQALTGDPTKIDPRERKRIVQSAIVRMEAGETLRQIAKDEGVNFNTLNRWLERARSGRDKYQKGEARRLLT